MPTFKLEAEIIYWCSVRGLQPPMADQMELWEIAAYLGLHRIETMEERDNREIVETKKEYWEETKDTELPSGETRAEYAAGYSERRRARAIERRRERAS